MIKPLLTSFTQEKKIFFFLLKLYQLGRGENTYLTVELKQKQKEE
jgi:hypothetical protein